MFLHLDSRSTSGSADKLGSAHKRCFVVTELQGPSKGPGLLGVINQGLLHALTTALIADSQGLPNFPGLPGSPRLPRKLRWTPR